jgi:predicted metal-dependent hydrolase
VSQAPETCGQGRDDRCEQFREQAGLISSKLDARLRGWGSEAALSTGQQTRRPLRPGNPYGEPVPDTALSTSAAPGVASAAGLLTVSGVVVEVRRSPRRRKTVSAYRQDGRIVVLIPARCSKAEERRWVETMVARLQSPRRRQRTDADLDTRARGLSRKHFGGKAEPTSVAWSDAQGRRWGSCTIATGAIRISSRLRGFPPYVLDYVLVHELAHLLVADHSSAFWELVARYPLAERARGFLDGVTYANGVPMPEMAGDVDDPAGEAPVLGLVDETP